MKKLGLIMVTVIAMFVFVNAVEARWYSPQMKRFISEDPMGYAAGDVNFYRYVGNSPLNFVDPLGLLPEDIYEWVLLQEKQNSEAWQGGSYTCNEFVTEALENGGCADITVPSVKYTSSHGGYNYPRVSDLASSNFATDRLSYREYSIGNAKIGDIVYWYSEEKRVNHSAIYIGNGKVAYQNPELGVKINSVEEVTKTFMVKPRIRRCEVYRR